ncbi:hypothetical protein [Pedobacter sandarakinus]|uniref:hypothetical protein n=1 Tax=Pedobacter sandarakinus TaxID=353156 RepID=UPI0022468534|nr:hypothetical protein [Pedobacter sandarakinus]MCX2573808.1 hypothetical protein [Pedobacter sandarakinus]
MRIIILFILIMLAGNSFGQPSSFQDEKAKIDDFLSKSIKLIKFKDTTTLYSFAFKLHIKKLKNKTLVDISSNDSLAFIWFPKIKSLYSINYNSLFVGNRKEIDLIIPILIGTYGSIHNKEMESLAVIEKIKSLFYNQKDKSAAALQVPDWKRDIVPKSYEMIYLYPFISIHDLNVYD